MCISLQEVACCSCINDFLQVLISKVTSPGLCSFIVIVLLSTNLNSDLFLCFIIQIGNLLDFIIQVCDQVKCFLTCPNFKCQRIRNTVFKNTNTA